MLSQARTNLGTQDFSLFQSKRSDSGERCEVKKAMKSRGGLGREVLSHLSRSLAFIFSRSFLLRTAPHYLNAWNRLYFFQNAALISHDFLDNAVLCFSRIKNVLRDSFSNQFLPARERRSIHLTKV